LSRAGKTRRSFSIKKKIWLSISILVIAYSASTIFGYFRSNQTKIHLAEVSEYLFPATLKIQKALEALNQEKTFYIDAVILGEPSLLDSAENKAADAIAALDQAISKLEKYGDYGSEEKAISQSLHDLAKSAQPINEKLRNDIDNEELIEEAGKVAAEAEKILEKLSKRTKHLSNELKGELALVSKDTEKQQILNLFIFSLGVVAALILVSEIITRSIITPLKKTAEMAKKMAEGDLSQKLGISQNDEIGDLVQAINIMATEIEHSQGNLELQVQQRTAELEEAHKKLVHIARQAGKADVATAVLHNVGNVLNSISVTSGSLTDMVRHSRIPKLGHIVSILEDNKDDLKNFITRDEQGNKILPYMNLLYDHFTKENTKMEQMLHALSGHVRHVAEIIERQQSYSKNVGMEEEVILSDVIEDAIQITDSKLIQMGIRVERNFDTKFKIHIDRHKTLEILVNLLSNAKEALVDRDKADRKISIGVIFDEDGAAIIEVSDNGVGITEENMPQIFTQGFTTRKNGHGFGLHHSFNSASEMGGNLSVFSKGKGLGAAFSLKLRTVELEIINV